MPIRRVNMSFLLLEKKVGEEDVIGLAEFWVDPIGKGIGKKALMMIEALASPKIVVGFAEPNVVGFYEACEWIIGGLHGEKYFVASGSIDESKFSGEIW